MRSKTIVLRAIEIKDIDILYLWENDPEVWKVSNTLVPFSRYVLEQYIINSHQDIFTNKQLRLMIETTDENKTTVGAIDLFDFDPKNKRAGIGILIDNIFRNKGYATEALNLLINYSFTTLDLHQLYCNICIDNKASLQLFEKVGFKIIGCKKDWIKLGNFYQDEYMLQYIKKV